jgi:hypothetical protein
MTDLVISIGIPATFALGWMLRGMKEIRHEQDITAQLFVRATAHEQKAISLMDRPEVAFMELGKARACVDAATLVAGIEQNDQILAQPGEISPNTTNE